METKHYVTYTSTEIGGASPYIDPPIDIDPPNIEFSVLT